MTALQLAVVILDLHLNGGVFNLGHRNPELVATLREALDALDVGNHHFPSSARAELGEALARLTPGDLQYSVFASGGGEAIDAALKTARHATKRRTIVSIQKGYHGHTGLALAAGVLYWWLFAWVHPWLFDDLYIGLTRGLSVERTAFLWRLLFYILFGGLLVLANVLFDYSKTRLVVEDRRSAAGAIAAAFRFLLHHPREVFGLYGLNALSFGGLLLVWALIAPGAGGAGVSMWLALIVTQIYIASRLLLKLQFIASQTALFQSRLAHAAYAAAPEPVWPESAAAETIVRHAR